MRRLAAALAGAAALLAGCGGSGGQAAAAGSPPAMPAHSVLQACPTPTGQAGQEVAGAARLSSMRLPCLGGGSFDPSGTQGTPTVVNLWGSWCGPCRDELPVMQQLADAAGGRVHVVGVVSKDGVPQAESFAEDAGLRFPSAFDGQGRLMTDEGLNALPVTFFLTADGVVAYRQVGPVSSLAQLEQLVGAHLGVQL